MRTSVVREPCYCCGGAECCAYDGDPTYSPPSGFTLESLICTNSNPKNCVGRADCEIKLSKAASPGVTCTLEPCKHSSRCNSGTNTPAAVTAAFFNHIKGMLSPYVQASAYSGPTGQGCYSPCSPPAGHGLTSSCSFDLLYGDTYATVPCAGNSSATVRQMLFEYTGINTGDLGCINPNTYCMTNYWASAIASLDAALRASPFKIVTVAGTGYTCEWVLWGANPTRNGQATNNVCYDYTYTTCSNIDNIIDHRVQWIQLQCSVRCNVNPCGSVTGPSWDLELGCDCDSEYSPPNPGSTPECNLHLYDSSGPAYENDKCIWTAKYGGRVQAGIVDCDSSPDDDDCVCCEEGGSS